MKGGNKLIVRHSGDTIERFEDLIAWQEARVLTQEIYSNTREGPFKRDFSLREQLRRAAVSVMSNIAEGFERLGSREKVQFMNIARASCAEVKSLLYICLDNEYLDSRVINALHTRCTRISRLTSGLIRSVWRKGDQPKEKAGANPRIGRELEKEADSGL